MKLLYAIAFLLFGCTTVGAANRTTAVLSLPTLPLEFVQNRFAEIQQEFDKRVGLYSKGHPSYKWQSNRPESVILDEFSQINDWRFNIWYADPEAKTLISREDFMIAQDLLSQGLYRQSPYIAFQYNRTDASYNSSTVVLDGMQFLAMEAPTKQTLNNFYTLLQNHRVTQLVRLTSDQVAQVEKSYPYWNGKIKSSPQSKEAFLQFRRYPNPAPYALRYYFTDSWTNEDEIPAKRLLALVQNVRKHYDAKGLLACHSSNGSGRTGTFLAGFLILGEIDRQIAAGATKETLDISIAKVVMKLSLQRPYLVSNAKQYVLLYRLVDLYVANLNVTELTPKND